ncbi:MAG: hypothetical protein ACI8P3_001885, partial [Saprospiraceae bacterium]
GREKSVLIGGMLLGVLCLALSFFMDGSPHAGEIHSRFWTNFLHNAVFFTGISFISLFLICCAITAYAGWFAVVKRVWEAFAQFLIVGIILMSIIIAGIWFDWHHLYHWTDAAAVAADATLSGKSGFLNPTFYTIATLGIMSLWYFLFARPLRMMSIDEDKSGTADYAIYRKIKIYAAAFLPIAAFTSCALIWLWTMSIEPHWYSTMYAWYTTASWLVSALALSLLTVIYLKSKGLLEDVTEEHVHDLGKLLFAFSVFWTYLWFSQFMLIWYANIGEETTYFKTRRDEYPVLFFGNLIMNFGLPFLILMRNETKRKFGSVGFVALLVLFGHWWDFFYMIKPGVLKELSHADGVHGPLPSVTGFDFPHLLELGIFVGFLSLFFYFVFNQLTKATLRPVGDPYYAESIHHHS